MALRGAISYPSISIGASYPLVLEKHRIHGTKGTFTYMNTIKKLNRNLWQIIYHGIPCMPGPHYPLHPWNPVFGVYIYIYRIIVPRLDPIFVRSNILKLLEVKCLSHSLELFKGPRIKNLSSCDSSVILQEHLLTR